jgi:hypothetical protein
MNNTILVSQVTEVSADLGEPDCKLIEPFVVVQSTGELVPWCVDFTTQNEFMISSDKILTIADPNTTLLEKYKSLVS